MLKNYLFRFLFMALMGCSGNVAVAFANPSLCKPLEGAWENKISGKIITFKCSDDSNPLISTWFFTQSSYVLQQEPSIISDDDLAKIKISGNENIRIDHDDYYKTNEIPWPTPASPGSAVDNCKILTETFKEHYGFFNLRQVDFNEWKKQCDTAIKYDSLSEDFFRLLSTMLSQFGDNHIMLSRSIETSAPDYAGFELREPFATHLSAETKKYNVAHDTSFSISDYVDAVLIPQTHQYLSNQINLIKSANDMKIFWGTIKRHPDIVYLYIQSMEVGNIDELNELLDEMIVFIDANKISGVMIDVRFNQGGEDEIGRIIMSHFIAQKKIAYWKQSFYNDQRWSNPRAFVVQPAKQHNAGVPVVLLVSPITASAAESFSLAMSSLPQVKLIGDKTMGIFSDQFFRKLPNGWWFTLSNEKMLSADKKISYEKIGLPVSITTPFPFLSQLNEEEEPGMKEAVQLLRGTT
jgi:carboxyl-terminal processing protease